MKPIRRSLSTFAFAALLLSGCATGNLIEWAKGAPSAFKAPQEHQDVFVRAGGTVVAFPFAVIWDVVTFPLQLIWDSYPYGTEVDPADGEY